MRFSIIDWAASAPGLQDKDAWRQWASSPWPPQGDQVPALTEMPAMQRRRLERIGKFALQAAYDCQGLDVADLPLVFASRHGDAQRTHEMLKALAKGEPLSPTHFGLSIHNAIAAQYSIARQWKRNYSAVSAGASTAEAAIMEALGLIEEGADEVMVVMYDGLLPAPYLDHVEEGVAEYAWALRLGRASAVSASFSLSIAAEQASLNDHADGLPHGLHVLRFLLSENPLWTFSDGQRTWCWQRHA